MNTLNDVENACDLEMVSWAVIEKVREQGEEWIKELEKGTHPLLANFTVSQCEAVINFLKWGYNLEAKQ